MKLSLCSLVALPCVAVCMAAGVPALADTFAFNANVNGLNWTGSGTLSAVADANLVNAFDITSISGTLDGFAITSLLPCAAHDPSHPCISTGNGFYYDNLFYNQNGVLHLDSIGFALGDSGLAGGFGSFGTHLYVFTLNVPEDQYRNGTFYIAPVPEPGNFILLGTGLLGIVGTLRRRIGMQRQD